MDHEFENARERTVEEVAKDVRHQAKLLEKTLRVSLKISRYKGEEAYSGQHVEMKAQTMLAIRHLEDARMRAGKILQYADDGVSIFDK